MVEMGAYFCCPKKKRDWIGFLSLNKKSKSWHKTTLVFLFSATLLSAIILILQLINQEEKTIYTYKNFKQHRDKYLIKTSTCKIINRDPFGEDVKDYYYQLNDIDCNSGKGLLTYIEKKETIALLKINQTLFRAYSIFPIDCCYSPISRINENDIKLSKCLAFEQSAPIFDPIIKVTCSTRLSIVYSNIHAIIHPQFIAKKTEFATRPYNVVLIGIDSVSKLNLIRTMPQTYSFLETNDFINLKGYTKIDDNTFPNLMAVLTGQTYDQVYQNCQPVRNTLDDCNFIWSSFNQSGYVTAFAEDEIWMSTFNHYYKGFENPPTDYYFRSYIQAVESLPSKMRQQMHYCTGPENTAERILNLAKDFVVDSEKPPKFGFFWINSFSHNNINGPTAMDHRLVHFLEDFYQKLNNTVFVFFSDHGFRFGKIRRTYTGWLEERLPFIYIHLPDSFKQQHPQKYSNILVNSERLTSPYDLHQSLQDLLSMADPSFEIKPSLACPKCRSLFDPITENRKCSDAEISDNWCLCSGFSYVSTKSAYMQTVANFIVEQVNRKIGTFDEGDKCAQYFLYEVISASATPNELNAKNEYVYNLRVIIRTRPPSLFEATVEVNEDKELRLLNDFSRLDRYAKNVKCLSKGSKLEKYCYCDGPFTAMISALCVFFDCI